MIFGHHHRARYYVQQTICTFSPCTCLCFHSRHFWSGLLKFLLVSFLTKAACTVCSILLLSCVEPHCSLMYSDIYRIHGNINIYTFWIRWCLGLKYKFDFTFVITVSYLISQYVISFNFICLHMGMNICKIYMMYIWYIYI